MSRGNAVLVIVLCAAITYFWRVLPFAVFSGKRKMPPVLDSLGKLLPAAVMMILVVYSYRSMMNTDGHTALMMIVAGIVTAVIHLKRRNTILSVFVGTFVYIVLLNWF